MSKNLSLVVALILVILFGCMQPAQAQGPPKKKITLDDVAKALEVTNNKLDNLEKKLDANQDENRAEFKKLNKRLDDIDTRLTNVELGISELRTEMKMLGVQIAKVDEKAERALLQLAIVIARQDKADAERGRILENQAYIKGQLSVLKDRPASVPATVVVNNNPSQCQAQCVRPCGCYTRSIPYGWSWYQATSGGAYRLYRNPITGFVSYDWYAASSSVETVVY